MSLLDRVVSLLVPLVPRPIIRHFSKPYIAGDGIEDAFRVVREVAGEGAMATLDILGEFISRAEEAEANTRQYQELVKQISARGLRETNVSVKLTALGLLLDRELCLRNMRALLATVDAENNFARIDMEDSGCTEATLGIYRDLRAEFPTRVGVALQAYLRRTPDDAVRLSEEPANFRLCKGIYVEPRAVAYQDYDIVRRNFVLTLERMFERGAYVGIATHDELLVWEALRLIDRHGLEREQYEFQMLLGVDEPLRRILIKAGHRLRVYVPYGQHWYSYSVRRLRENPKIAGYAFKAILGRR
jgi:proline dehydrogenase